MARQRHHESPEHTQKDQANTTSEPPSPIPAPSDSTLTEAPEQRATDVTPEQEAMAKEQGAGSPFPIVGIGASAGGLEASTDLLKALPNDTGMAFVFVHHLAPEHESLLADILARATSMPVAFAQDGLRIEQNRVYVIPPNAFLAIFHGTLNLMPNEPSRGIRTAIDYFMRSLAEDQRNMAIGVVLSGTGSDGALGVRAIKAEDGTTFAQDPDEAAYDGMPRSAIATGVIDFTLPAKDIASELARLSQHPYLRPDKGSAPSQQAAEDDNVTMERIFLMLRESAGVDFTYYKPTTVRRRIGRRMMVHRMVRLDEYAALLKSDPTETEGLYRDLLINVTGFFREPESFEALKRDVFPKLLEGRSQSDPIRIWVPGCSTGEEPYSLAIALTEFLADKQVKPAIQIFATDISDTSIEKARQAIYPENVAADMPPGTLEKHFIRTDGGYQVNKTIRDTCIFAKHDVTRDPPFSRLDLVSCRNLLIYLGKVLQRRLIPLFHYALNPSGFLLLGSSESVGEHTDLFTTVDPKYRIYAKKASAIRPPLDFGYHPYQGDILKPRSDRGPLRTLDDDVQREADRLALDRFVPPGVLVNGDLDILQFRGDTDPYLRHPSGRPTLNLLSMARAGLDTALRAASPRLTEASTTVRLPGIHIEQEAGSLVTDVEIVPMHRSGGARYFMVFFHTPEEVSGPDRAVRLERLSESDFTVVDRLQLELDRTRDQLRAAIEEKDGSVEELRAANEEVQSSNEELQSINEELETAKEELQSTNEELTTLNEELQNRNFELLSMNDDFRNVLASVNIPIIILGKDLRIRRYTPMAERVLSLIPTDIGRPITDLKLKIDVQDLPLMIRDVLESLAVSARDVRDDVGHLFRLQIRPYRTSEDKIEGVVIAMLDVEDMRQREEHLVGPAEVPGDSLAYVRVMLDTMLEPFVVLDDALRIIGSSQEFATLFNATTGDLTGRRIEEVGLNSEIASRLLEVARAAEERGSADVMLEIALPKGKKTIRARAGRIERADAPPLILVAMVGA